MELSDIRDGKYFCLYQVLNALLAKSGALAVSVVREQDRGWHTVYEVVDDLSHRFSTMPRAIQDEILHSENPPGKVWWPREYRISGKRECSVVVRVVFRRTMPNLVRTHFVVLRSPLWSRFDASQEDLAFYSQWAVEIIWTWFAWTAVAREERRHRVEDAAPRPPSNRHALLPWPIPFQEIVEFARPGPAAPARDLRADIQNLTNLVCFPNQRSLPGAEWCDWPNRPCLGNPHRQDFEALAPLIPWRFAFPENSLTDDAQFERTVQPLLAVAPRLVDHSAEQRLGDKELHRYFGRHFWAEWLANWKKHAQGRGTRERLLRVGTLLAHDLIGDMPVEEQTIEALVWAVSRYAHDVLGIDARLDIASHLLQSARNEPALHVLKQYYRDHFFHSLEVAFLGHLLLEEVSLGDDEKLIDRVRAILHLASNRQVLREWYVAALLHDIGYTVEILLGVEEALRFYHHSGELAALQDGIEKLIDQLTSRIHGRMFEGFRISDKPGRDHGVVGALHLRSLIDHIRKNKPGVYQYPWAVKAIAAHNHRGKRPSFSNEPLTFLLILCDSLQEWNRPHLLYSTAAATMISRLFLRSEIGDVSGAVVRSSVRLPSGSGSGPASKRIEFDLVYGDEINTNAGVFNLWLDTSSNLQRLNFDGFPLGIQVNLFTPRFRRGDGAELQMDRLREAAEETHMNFLAEWFPSPDNRAVRYFPDARTAGRDMELVSLDLREIAALCPITASMRTFFKLFSHWRRFSEDRIFAGDYASEPPG